MKINHNFSRDILSNCPDSCYLIITDGSNIIIDINEKFIDDFGYIANKNMPSIGNILLTDILNHSAQDTVLHFPRNEYKLKNNILCSDGQYISIQWSSFPLEINNLKHTITFGVDITDWESVTQQLIATTQQLITLNNSEQSKVETIIPKLKVS